MNSLDDILVRQLSPEERDAYALSEDKVLGSAYLKLKRRGLRRRGRPIRRNMFEAPAPSRRSRG